MKENFLHFLSKENCILSINGKHIGIIDNINTFELDIITNTKNIFVSYSPIINASNYIPYTFNLETNNYPHTDSNYIRIIPFPNNHYDIIMEPFYYHKTSIGKIILNESVGKYFVSILSDNRSKITIFSGTSVVFYLETFFLINAKAYIKNDILIIEGITEDKNKYYLLVINTTDFSIIHNDISQSIENSDDFIQSYKKINNIAHNAEIVKIIYATKEKEKFFVYENNTPVPPSSKLLIPMSFLESLIINDERCAKSFLSDNYLSATIQQLKNYFGSINEIYFNRHQTKENIFNYTILSDKYKNYDFIIEDNKIIDIKEIF